MTAKKIALFIDADNISFKFGKQIFDALEHRGEIFIRRIYGNWEKPSLRGWNDCILNFSLRPVQQIDFATGKNATDMSLTIDAMDVLHGGKAEVFALVSNDSDFTPLAIRLREGGMNVIGLGGGQVSNSFRAACSEFIELTAQEGAPVELPTFQPTPKIVKKNKPAQAKPTVQMSLFDEEKIVALTTPDPLPGTPAPPVTTNPKVIPINDSKGQTDGDKNLQQVHAVLRETAALHGDAKGFATLSWAGDAIGKKNLSLKGSGHSSLKKFLTAFPNLYEVKGAGAGTAYRCIDGTAKTPVVNDKLKQIHGVLRETAKAHADATGFVNLGFAGNALATRNISLKGSGHTMLSKFIAAFPNLYELGKNAYRCR